MAVLGLLGACMLWPILLTVQRLQYYFPSYLLFSLTQGICFGLVFGAVFGSTEGIIVSSKTKAIKGLAFGALFGAAAGAVGVLLGQLFLFFAASRLFRSSTSELQTGLILSNGIAWLIIGTFISMTEGLRSRSSRKLLAGFIGGFLGALAGGLVLSALQFYRPDGRFSLLAGLCIFGFMLSACYSLLENRFQNGALKLLNGPLKSKEYPVISKKTSIGSAPDCDIVLKDYPGVLPLHAYVQIEKGKIYLKPAGTGSKLLLNDAPPGGESLRVEDVITLGKAKFLYAYFS